MTEVDYVDFYLVGVILRSPFLIFRVKNRRDSSGRVRCIPGEYAKIRKASNFSHLKTAKERETYPTETVSSKNIKFHRNFSRNSLPDAEGGKFLEPVF